MDPDTMLRVYQASTHALHLYLYEGEILIGDAYFALHPGDITLTPAGVPSSYRLSCPGKHWCVHFTPMQPDGGETEVRLPLHLRLGAQRGYAEDRLRDISRQHSTPSPTQEAGNIALGMASARLQEFLLWLSRGASQPEDTDANSKRLDLAFDELVTFVDEHLTSALNIPALIKRTEFSQNYFAKRFRQRFGVTIQAYIRSRRMDMAKYLLEHTPLPVAEIGRRVGLPDPQHLNKTFREVTGTSPSRHRAEACTRFHLRPQTDT